MILNFISIIIFSLKKGDFQTVHQKVIKTRR